MKVLSLSTIIVLSIFLTGCPRTGVVTQAKVDIINNNIIFSGFKQKKWFFFEDNRPYYLTSINVSELNTKGTAWFVERQENDPPSLIKERIEYGERIQSAKTIDPPQELKLNKNYIFNISFIVAMKMDKNGYGEQEPDSWSSTTFCLQRIKETLVVKKQCK
jgi:hypothetical protein